MQYSSYNDIQKTIDHLYTQPFVQPNAFYPTRLCYIESVRGTTSLYGDLFLDTFKIKGIDEPVSFESFLQKEQSFHGTDAPETVLQNFLKVSSLSSVEVPLQKNKNGSLGNSKTSGGSTAISLTFVCDRGFQTIEWLQKWQRFWYVYTKRQHVLTAHTSETLGEGYLGLDNLLIKTDGTCERLSHLSIFGIVPIKIDFLKTEFGPQAAPSLSTITVKCICSQAVLVTPHPDPTYTTLEGKRTALFIPFSN